MNDRFSKSVFRFHLMSHHHHHHHFLICVEKHVVIYMHLYTQPLQLCKTNITSYRNCLVKWDQEKLTSLPKVLQNVIVTMHTQILGSVPKFKT